MLLLPQEPVGVIPIIPTSSNDPFNPSLRGGENIKWDQLRFNKQKKIISNSFSHLLGTIHPLLPAPWRPKLSARQWRNRSSSRTCGGTQAEGPFGMGRLEGMPFPGSGPGVGGSETSFLFFISIIFVQKGRASRGDGQDKRALS